MTADANAVARFWTWVAAREQSLRAITDRDAPILDELLERLHACSPGLFFELGGTPGDTTELIITAEGVAERFDAVRQVVRAAPALTGWEFIAFKPAHGFAFVTQHGQARIDAARSWFLPLESASRPDQFGIRLACDEYDPDAHEDFLFAAYIVIDTGLGELAAARDVHHIEVELTPATPATSDYLPLPELPAFLSRRRS